jgi:hypothetical protein
MSTHWKMEYKWSYNKSRDHNYDTMDVNKLTQALIRATSQI